MSKNSLILLTAAALSSIAIGGVAASSASANTATVGPWDLVESTAKTWGNYLGVDTTQRFRWISDTAHSTRISTNGCYDYSLNNISDYGAHDTSYHNLGNWAGYCVALRGRSLYGNQNNLVGNFIY